MLRRTAARTGARGRPDTLVWASDCPFVGHEGKFAYRDTIDWLIDAIPDAAAREKIFGGTARKLYFNGE